MRIAIASSSLVALPTLTLLSQSNLHSIELLISTPDAPAGRGKAISPNEFSQFFERDSRLCKPRTFSEITELIDRHLLDLVIVIAYGKIIPHEILKKPKHGWINLHFSLLPRYRGAAPVQRSIINGESKTGVTVFQLDEGMDTGPIYVVREYDIPYEATTGEVLLDLSEIGATAVLEAVTKISHGEHPQSQSGHEMSLAPKITKNEGRINWDLSSKQIINLIRAFNPNPLAWTTLDGKRLNIVKARLADEKNMKPGEIVFRDGSIIIGTSDEAILIESLTPEGKRMMTGSEWARGYRFSGQRCL